MKKGTVVAALCLTTALVVSFAFVGLGYTARPELESLVDLPKLEVQSDLPIFAPKWEEPVPQPVSLPAESSSVRKPAYVPSRNAIVRASDIEAARWSGPPGPSSKWLKHPTDDDVERAKQVRSWQEERGPIVALPQMTALRILANRVSDYRQAALYAGADDLAQALLQREIALKGLGMDGALPPDVVRHQACVWTDVAATCNLPTYVSCEAAKTLQAAAQAICTDPTQPFDPTAEFVATDTLERLSAH